MDYIINGQIAELLGRLTELARPTELEPELIDVGKMAYILGIGERTVRRLDTEGRLPIPVKLGGSIRWRLNEVRQWVRAGCPGRQKWEDIKTSA